MDTLTNVPTQKMTFSQSEKVMYRQFRKKINAEAARAQIAKLEYDLADVKAGTQTPWGLAGYACCPVS